MDSELPVALPNVHKMFILIGGDLANRVTRHLGGCALTLESVESINQLLSSYISTITSQKILRMSFLND